MTHSAHRKSAAVLLGARASANLLAVDPWDDPRWGGLNKRKRLADPFGHLQPFSFASVTRAKKDQTLPQQDSSASTNIRATSLIWYFAFQPSCKAALVGLPRPIVSSVGRNKD
jgi:hypothetical protein